jgi:hypothetical protein
MITPFSNISVNSPKWRGHKNDSELMQEMSDIVGVMPRYNGHDKESHA